MFIEQIPWLAILPDYPASPVKSIVLSADHPGLSFNLTLVRTEPTYSQPVQQWMFISDFAVSRPLFPHFVVLRTFLFTLL